MMSGLARRLRRVVTTRKRTPRPPLPVDWSLLAEASVLGFDGALVKTGWAVVALDADGLVIADGGMLRTNSMLTGFEKTFERAEQLSPLIQGVLNLWGTRVIHVVAERPAVAGYRTESSLLAVREVWRYSRPTLVSRDHAVAVFCGSGKHDKPAVVKVVRAWLAAAASVPHDLKITEDVADAILLCLCHLYDLAHPGGGRA